MKLDGVIAFFEGKLNGLKFKQWDLPFSFDNIPSNILDRAYFISVGQIQSGPANQHIHQYSVPISVRLFYKGARDPLGAMKSALAEATDVSAAILVPSVRTANGFEDIRPVTVQPFQLSSTNDNSLILELVFECILNYRFQ